MKKIKKLTKTVAGSALLVGATLAGAASMGAAQDDGSSGMSLGDYPAPFVDDDGEVDTTVVVGESAATVDVVGGINIAGSLGNAALSEDEVSVGGSTGGSWSATNGQTLDTANDQLFFNSYLDDVRDTLTDEQLNMLATTEAFSGDMDQQVEQYLYVGNRQVQFGQPGDLDDEDPQVYVSLPTNTQANTESNYLYQLQANFEDGVEFLDTNEDDYRNDDVYGEEVEMFGQEFTISDDSFYGNHEDQLVLYGSQEVTSVSTGESTTITVGGEEHTFEVIGVTNSDTAAVEIDGDLDEYNADDEETLSGESVRIDNIIQTNEDNSQGTVQFAIGSEQVTLESGSEVMLGEDEEEVDGTDVNLDYDTNGGDGDVSDGSDQVELSSLQIAFGAKDNDENYVTADGSYENEVFEDLAFRFGGLNPDTASDDAEGVTEVDYASEGDDTATVSITDGDDSASIPFVYDTNGAASGGGEALQPDENEDFVVVEGQEVEQDDYFVTDAGDFSHVWEVTDIDRDTDASNSAPQSDDEATIELTDVVTGADVEVDLDADSDAADGQDEDYVGTEVIDGQTYNFFLDGDSTGDGSGASPSGNNGGFHVTWDSSASVQDDGSSISTGDRVSTFTAVDTDSRGSVAFADESYVTQGESLTDTDIDNNGGTVLTVELPSTESTDRRTADFELLVSNGTGGATDGQAFIDIGDDATTDSSNAEVGPVDTTSGGNSDSGTFEVGQVDYVVTLESTTTNDAVDVSVGISNDQSDSTSTTTLGPASMTIQPEDDNDNEHAFIVEPVNDNSDDEEMDVGGSQASQYYTDGTFTSLTTEMESDSDMEVGHNFYGTYVEHDTDDPGSVTLNVPGGQSTAGAAFTSDAGELSASGGASTAMTMQPTGWPDAAALDSDVTSSDRNNENMILVGGPAVNTLVQELADANKTMQGSEYEEGDAMVQLVEDAFSTGNHALVVAGYAGEDTRAASNYIANYEDNSDELSGQDQVMVSTS